LSNQSKRKELNEDAGEGVMLLIDTFPFDYSVKLVEAKGGNEKWLEVEGRFQHADLQNQNGRIYPRGLWEKVLGDDNVKHSLKEGAMLGELDHPDDGKTSLKRVSHIVTGLKMLESGEVVGKARILNNEQGRQLKEIIAAGGKVGISSRGSGSVKPSMNGVQVVQEDYKLNTFDFVVTPSTPNAFPKPTNLEQATTETILTQNTDSVQEEYMSTTKLTELKDEVRKAVKRANKPLTESQKINLENELIDLEVKLNGLTEDKNVSSIAVDLADQVKTARKNLFEKEEEEEDDEEEDEPKGKESDEDDEDDEDDEEFVGDKSASKKQKFMKGNTVGMGEELSDDEKEFFEAVMSQVSTDEAETAMRQLAIVEKYAEADRTSMAMVINALRTKVHQLSTNNTNESLSVNEDIEDLLAENEVLRDHVARLETIIDRYQSLVVEQEEEEAEVEEEEETEVEHVGDKTFMVPIGSSIQQEGFEVPRSLGVRIQEEHDGMKSAGAALAKNAIKLLKKNNKGSFERSGQIMESVKNVK